MITPKHVPLYCKRILLQYGFSLQHLSSRLGPDLIENVDVFTTNSDTNTPLVDGTVVYEYSSIELVMVELLSFHTKTVELLWHITTEVILSLQRPNDIDIM